MNPLGLESKSYSELQKQKQQPPQFKHYIRGCLFHMLRWLRPEYRNRFHFYPVISNKFAFTNHAVQYTRLAIVVPNTLMMPSLTHRAVVIRRVRAPVALFSPDNLAMFHKIPGNKLVRAVGAVSRQPKLPKPNSPHRAITGSGIISAAFKCQSFPAN